MTEHELSHELYAEPEVYQGEIFDAPNQQAVGLEPPWVEGTGGQEGEPPEPIAAEETSVDLDAMTKAELLAYAQSIGVSPANNDMTKDEIRAGIDAHEAAEG